MKLTLSALCFPLALAHQQQMKPHVTPYMLQSERDVLRPLDKNNVAYSLYDVNIDNGMHIHTLKADSAPSTANSLPAPYMQEVPVVLLHGFTGALGSWRNVIPHLTKRGYTVYAIDMLGWGYSSRPQVFSNWEFVSRIFGKERKTVEDVTDFWVDSLESWRRNAGLDKIQIVGHSMGGWVAGEYALRFPQHVAKVTLACSVGVYKHDTTWFGDGIGPLGVVMETTRAVFGINWPFRLLRGVDWATGGMLADRMASRGNWTDSLNYIRASMTPPPSGEIAAEYLSRRSDPGDSHVLWDRLPAVDFPVTLIYTESDTTVPAFDERILGQLRNSPRVDVSKIGFGAGHSTQAPEVVEAFVAAMLGHDEKREYMGRVPGGIIQSVVSVGGVVCQEQTTPAQAVTEPTATASHSTRKQPPNL